MIAHTYHVLAVSISDAFDMVIHNNKEHSVLIFNNSVKLEDPRILGGQLFYVRVAHLERTKVYRKLLGMEGKAWYTVYTGEIVGWSTDKDLLLL